MNLELSYSINHVLILGAGASGDYGLPMWKELSLQIQKKINEDKGKVYGYKTEIMDWINKINENKGYKTIDECIARESVSDTYPDGDEIEDQIFRIIKEIFNEQYKKDAVGWIRNLNDLILLDDKKKLEYSIAFINYNYDRILEDLLLNYSYLHKKKRRNNNRERLEGLDHVLIDILYPHGNLYNEEELDPARHTTRHIKNMKSHDNTQVNAVSCYESDVHYVGKQNMVSKLNLYILGLGGGLEVNLQNINFNNSINQIHITARSESFRDRAVSFLSKKYKIAETEIKIYSSCEELIQKCF